MGPRPVVIDEPSDGCELFLAPEDRVLGHVRGPFDGLRSWQRSPS